CNFSVTANRPFSSAGELIRNGCRDGTTAMVWPWPLTYQPRSSLEALPRPRSRALRVEPPPPSAPHTPPSPTAPPPTSSPPPPRPPRARRRSPPPCLSRQFFIDLQERLCPIPVQRPGRRSFLVVPQQPVDGPVNARVWVVAIPA